MKLDEIVSSVWGAIGIGVIAFSLTHCTPRNHGKLEGSPAALRAMFDGMNGMITNGKASADQDTAHWIHRKAEDKELTIRNRDGRTMWQKITGAMSGSTKEGQ
jgi:hypothetical protein